VTARLHGAVAWAQSPHASSDPEDAETMDP
jgi:hypothetical protein